MAAQLRPSGYVRHATAEEAVACTPESGVGMSAATTGTIPAYAPAGAVCGEATGGTCAGDASGVRETTPTSRLWPVHLSPPASTPPLTAAPSSGSCQVRLMSSSARGVSEVPSSYTSTVSPSPRPQSHQNAAWQSPQVRQHRFGTAEDIAAVSRPMGGTRPAGIFGETAALLSPGNRGVPSDATNISGTSPYIPATEATPTSKILKQPSAARDVHNASEQRVQCKRFDSRAASAASSNVSVTQQASPSFGKSNTTANLQRSAPAETESHVSMPENRPRNRAWPTSTDSTVGSSDRRFKRTHAEQKSQEPTLKHQASSRAEASLDTARPPTASAAFPRPTARNTRGAPPATNVSEDAVLPCGGLPEEVRAVAARLRAIEGAPEGARRTLVTHEAQATKDTEEKAATPPPRKEHGHQRYPDTPESSSVAWGPERRGSPAESDAAGPPAPRQLFQGAEESTRTPRDDVSDLSLRAQQPCGSRGAGPSVAQDCSLSSLGQRKAGGSWQAAWMQANADGGADSSLPSAAPQTELQLAQQRRRETAAAAEAARVAAAAAAAARQSAHWKRGEMERAVRFAPLATSAAAAARSAAAAARTAAKDSDTAAAKRDAVRAKAQQLLAMPLGAWRRQQR